MTTDKTADDDKVITSIQRQFRGGEHRLAGQRASEFIYASGKANQKLSDKVIEAIPGIERYISAPEVGNTFVGDEGGNPLATQPENRTDGADATNLSTDKAIAEQNAIDKKLEKGRATRVKKQAEQAKQEAADQVGGEDATKLNPDASTLEGADKQ